MKLELLEMKVYIPSRYKSMKEINVLDLKRVCESNIEINYLDNYKDFDQFKSHVCKLISNGVLQTREHLSELACNIKSSKEMELVDYRMNVIFGFLISAWYLDNEEEYYEIFKEIVNAMVCKICKDMKLPEFQINSRVIYSRVPLNYKYDLMDVISNELIKKINDICVLNLKRHVNIGMDIEEASDRLYSCIKRYRESLPDVIGEKIDSKDKYYDSNWRSELSHKALKMLDTAASNVFKNPDFYSQYFEKTVLEEVVVFLENVSAIKRANIWYHIYKFQNMDYALEMYDKYLDHIVQKCTNLNNSDIILEIYKDELYKLNSGFAAGREGLWIGIRQKDEMEEELKKYKLFYDNIRIYMRDKIDTLQRSMHTITEEDVAKLHENVEMILDTCLENIFSITSVIILNNIDISEKLVRDVAEEVFPDKYQEYKDAMDNKVASRFARILNMTKNAGQMILEGKSDVEILVKHPSVVKEHKPALVKEAMDIIIKEDRKMGVALKQWNSKHEKLFTPFTKQEFLDMKFIVGDHEFTNDEKEEAFDFIKNNKLPYSLYMYKEVCRYLNKEEK